MMLHVGIYKFRLFKIYFKIVADLNLFVIKIIEEYKYGYHRIGFETKMCHKKLDL